jgi:6-phosphogluconolactonase
MNTDHALGALSRRALLRGAAALAAAGSAPGFQSSTQYAYVGTYTDRGQGIHQFRMESNGALRLVKTYRNVDSPSALAFDPMRRYLYAANEISNYNGTTTGAVSAYSINRANGELTFINSASSGGAGPAHLSVDPSGKYVLPANYGGGNVALLPIQSNGGVGEPSDVQTITGPLGPRNAVYGWPGSFAISGHDRPHAHMFETDPAGKFAFAADLATDRIFIYKLDAANGKLTPNEAQPYLQALGGAGPRHFVFHPNGKWFYHVNEEDSTATFSLYNASVGTLQAKQTLPALPSKFAGTSFASEIGLSPNGMYLYTLNRLFDSFAIFELNQTTGEMTALGHEWTRGSYPRSFAMDPSGKFMYVLNQRSDQIATFRVEENGRRLTFTGDFTPVGNPSSIVFLS